MAIPPFPSHDLAKLVLGYLAEEQLMTAYDEFLCASPYLDAFRNEFDRIFMTSLRNILAEYRAVKIYVESCKPFLLRKKLIQCSNLLEIVKFLVKYVDVNRLQAQEAIEKQSLKQSYSRSNVCDVCNSLSLGICVCKKTQKLVATLQPNRVESNSETSIETTSLADLPGNSVTNEKNVSIEALSRQSSGVQSNYSNVRNIHPVNPTNSAYFEQCLATNVPQENPKPNLVIEDISVVNTDECHQKSTDKFNIIPETVPGSSDMRPRWSNYNVENNTKPVYNTESFQEFATGVSGVNDNEKSTVPDSSTSENYNVSNLTSQDNKLNINPITNIKGPPKSQFLLKVRTQRSEPTKNVKITPKDDQRITIISDVKVDPFKSNVPKPMTSTPLMQMQRIVINGTPAYDPQSGLSHKYNKDEIMAMPTIILVPLSEASKHTTGTIVSSSQNVTIESSNTVTTSNKYPVMTSSTKSLGPLTIDVTSNNSKEQQNTDNVKEIKTQEPAKNPTEKSLVKTVDVTHNSLPKETSTAAHKTSTPHMLPPTRKSSSTPRRTSHVRVLDFTTPRRILHETINEQDPTNLLTNEVIDVDADSVVPTNVEVIDVDKQSEKDKEIKKIKKSLYLKENCVKRSKKNWDAELRAMASASSNTVVDSQFTTRPRTLTSNRKSILVDDTDKNSETNKAGSKKNVLPKTKKLKKVKTKSTEIKKPVDELISIIELPDDQPIISIVEPGRCTKKINTKSTDDKRPIIGVVESDCCEPKADKDLSTENHKINISDETMDTPEAERLSLHNVIGTKLNISDILETPYKQVLYDLQMETPKFLGPDLPGEPVSDIKIMNIPTPRFFDTPKYSQATPSSYSSRPTDYSSGGSYYKPDDQDIIPELIQCSIVLEKEPCAKGKLEKEAEVKEKSETAANVEKSGRPQRKCTRNVSYKNSTLNKDVDSSNMSNASISNVTTRVKKDKSIDSKTKSKSNTSRKKVISTPKSPFNKETPKKYIKIKPFKTTPLKSSSKTKRKSDVFQTLSSKSLSRKISSKDKIDSVTPVVTNVPTKSRRKSSTPRKLDCTKSYKDTVDTNTPPDRTNSTHEKNSEDNIYNIEDSDTEHPPLRWSDDGSQDAKTKTIDATHDDDDINKIKEYIETTVPARQSDSEGNFQKDLVKRGFDIETAKIIERDLLDTIPVQDRTVQSSGDVILNKPEQSNANEKIDSDSSINLQIVQNEEDEIEEIELSVHECCEESDNFITCEFDENKFELKSDNAKLKDKFCMEVCIEDGLTIRLRSSPFVTLFDENPDLYNPKETEDAVSSISDISKLYTPLKDRRAACYEIFDSTLTSIDTPIKINEKECLETVTVIVDEENVLNVKDIDERAAHVKDKDENAVNVKDKKDNVPNVKNKEEHLLNVKDKKEIVANTKDKEETVSNLKDKDTKKRKRVSSEVTEESLSKKTKSNEYLNLKPPPNMQNMDIESLLSKLHGP